LASDETPVPALLKVRGSSDATRLASAISHAVYAGKDVTVRAIGAGAVNQTQKAVAIANGFVASRGYRLATLPSFTNVEMDDATVTAMSFHIMRL